MQYRVVNVDTILYLEERVASYISEGWIPQGGISVCMVYDQVRYIQAMIKH